MGRWKLATVLLGATAAAAFVCVIGAAQLWIYPYPRVAFLGAAYYFACAAVIFFVVALFLDDISNWILSRKSIVIRVLLSGFVAILFTGLMLWALLFVATGTRSLARLQPCAFAELDRICSKTEANLTDTDHLRLKREAMPHYVPKGLSVPLVLSVER